MTYAIHGKPVKFDGVCGLYKEKHGGIGVGYAVMDPASFASMINGMPTDNAIKVVTAVRDMAAEQSTWQHTPQNIGYPILLQSPEPDPISEVRENIANTVSFCDAVLNALQGK